MSVINIQDSLGISNSGKLKDLSLFDLAYGKEIRVLAEGSKSMSFISNEDLKEEEEILVSKRSRKVNNKHRFSISDELGAWVYKVQNARLNNANKVRN